MLPTSGSRAAKPQAQMQLRPTGPAPQPPAALHGPAAVGKGAGASEVVPVGGRLSRGDQRSPSHVPPAAAAQRDARARETHRRLPPWSLGFEVRAHSHSSEGNPVVSAR